MWGNIITEVSFWTNFHMGFSNTKSDILIHLTQWQYWWWFWFSYFWALYFLLFMRILRFRVLKFNPRIATTLRPHGKWGDLIICLLPVSWCINILTNSNFILRMIEWQAESSLFTVRIRAKQWYWVYKFELKTVTDILSAPKNVGTNKWVISNPLDLQVADDYLHILQIRTQQKWIKNYWDNEMVKEMTTDKSRVTVSTNYSHLSHTKKLNDNVGILDTASLSNFGLLQNLDAQTPEFNHYNNLNTTAHTLFYFKSKNTTWLDLPIDIKYGFNDTVVYGDDLDIFAGDRRNVLHANKVVLGAILEKPFKKSYNTLTTNNSDISETFRWVKKPQGGKLPMRIIKNPLNVMLNSSDESVDLFRVRWNTDEATVNHKVIPHSYYWTFKQKRYKRRKSIAIRYRYFRDENGKLTQRVKHMHKPIINQNDMLIDSVDFNRMVFYKFYKKMKKRVENVSLPYSKRLLRTKKILVLPAHVNLTVITNSYDVVHSWFIPGLGLKMDCIPGRATHHVLHIDNVGFYYGQCAEICGRYHHHMPIRLCALPFEHFLVWWHSFALPKIVTTTDQKRLANYYAFRKYVW